MVDVGLYIGRGGRGVIYFISFGLGFFWLGFIGMLPMGGIFAAGGLAAVNDIEPLKNNYADAIMYGSFIAAIVSFGVYVYGQKLLWSDTHETYWIPSLLIMNGLFMLAALFVTTFLVLTD